MKHQAKTIKLPLPSDLEFHEDICLIVWRPRGLLNRVAANKLISVIGELEFALKKPFNRFLDTIAADAVDLNLEYIRRVSVYRRRVYGNRPAIKTAILATDSTVAGYGRLHASLTQDSPINVRVFQDRKEAAQWLGVPFELLAAKPIGDGYQSKLERDQLHKTDPAMTQITQSSDSQVTTFLINLTT